MTVSRERTPMSPGQALLLAKAIIRRVMEQSRRPPPPAQNPSKPLG